MTAKCGGAPDIANAMVHWIAVSLGIAGLFTLQWEY